MHGRSQQHTCMILMGGQAAGHPHPEKWTLLFVLWTEQTVGDRILQA